MTYVKTETGQVIEFSGRRPARKSYDMMKQAAEAPERPASAAVVLAGRILKPLTTFIRKRFGISAVTAHAGFHEDDYSFWITITKTDNTQKSAMFCEGPSGKFRVWR